MNNIENLDLNCLDNLKQLTFLIIRNKANTEIKNIEQIYKLKTLKILHVDKNTLSQIDVERLKREIPGVKLKNIGNHFVIKF